LFDKEMFSLANKCDRYFSKRLEDEDGVFPIKHALLINRIESFRRQNFSVGSGCKTNPMLSKVGVH
jgi:hypothetical protein